MKTLTGKPIFLVLFVLLCLLPSSRGATQQEAGVCAEVKIQISQKVAITRTAFQATLQIGNSPINVPLQNVSVTLDIRDPANNPANALFGISNPVLTSISDVAGTGTIAPGTQATAVWTILPTRDAAPLAGTQYTVGGTISYTQAGINVSLPLFPAPITVVPDPLLQFHYFLERQVYGDDPFTPEVEPSEPFSLGLLVVNKGAGTAHNLTITSSQPKIVDNQKGLQIEFQIIGSFVNNQPAAPSLQVNLGDIAPASTSVADWLMLSTLQGKFLAFSASFKHNDDLNNPRTSILDSVDTHFLEHVVRIVDPADDGKPDFLYFKVDPLSTDLSPIPDTVWSSDGTTAPVTAFDSASDDVLPLPPFLTDGPVTNTNLTVHFVVPNTPAGFLYIRADDPGQNSYQLMSVTRSDGKVIVLGDNAWATHRIVRLKDAAPYMQNRVYLFDDNTAGTGTLSYTLTYAPMIPVSPMVTLTSPHDGDMFSPNTTLSVAASASSLQTIVKELDFYDGSTQIGSSLNAPFTLSYLPGIGTHVLTAVATDANGTTGTSAPINITVSAAAKPPVIQITGPADATELFAPATVIVAASASEPGGTISKVDFYSNSIFLGSAGNAPFTTSLESLPPGDYILTAVATDTSGGTTTSAPVTFIVKPSLSETNTAILRVVAAVRQTTPGQLMVTVQNSGGMNAVNTTLIAAKIKWGGKSPTSISPASVSMLSPNSSTTFMLQFPATAAGPFVIMTGTYSGHSFSGMTRVTP